MPCNFKKQLVFQETRRLYISWCN